MVALGPIIGPRKSDCACSCSCDPTESLCVLPGSSPFHKRAPVTLCSKHNNKKEELMRLSQGVSTLAPSFSLGCVKGFCSMEIKMSLFRSPPST